MSEQETALAPVPGKALDISRVRLEFMASQHKLKEFCSLYPEYPQLFKIATVERWASQREHERYKSAVLVQKNLTESVTDLELKIDRPVHRAGKQLVSLIGQILSDTTKLQQRIRDGEIEGKVLGLDDLPKLRAGVEALEKMYRLTRVSARLTPEPTPVGSELDLEKLSHEERVVMQGLLKKAARGTEH